MKVLYSCNSHSFLQPSKLLCLVLGTRVTRCVGKDFEAGKLPSLLAMLELFLCTVSVNLFRFVFWPCFYKSSLLSGDTNL